MSDYNAIGELIRHGVAADLAQAAALALKAGVDIDMMADAYRRGLPIALRTRLGEHGGYRCLGAPGAAAEGAAGTVRGSVPPRHDAAKAAPVIAARRRLARAAGARSIVMLKNDGILPLTETRGECLAVIGPLADAAAEMRGPWWGAAEPEDAVSVVAGLRGMLGESRVAASAGRRNRRRERLPASRVRSSCARRRMRFVLCLGESAAMSGEAASRAHLGLPGRQRELAEAVLERARALRKPVIVVLFSGRPLIVPWLIEQADAVLAAWFPGSEAGNAIADLIIGRVSPSGRTPVSWPCAVGQVPMFFGQRPSGRPADPQDRFTSKYLDVPDGPLFAFGHGLTYGEFALSNLRLSATARQGT